MITPNSLTDFNVLSDNLENSLKTIDMHLHTALSDGKVDLQTLLEQLSKKSFSLSSITDHNEIGAYVDSTFDYCIEHNINILPGSEIDCGSGLDVHIYDRRANTISNEFKGFVTPLIESENKKRLQAAEESLHDFKLLFSENAKYPWLKLDRIKEKALIEDRLTVENLQRIDLVTGELGEIRRTYVSKPHIGKLFESLGLIDWDIFMKEENVVDSHNKEKKLYKILFSQITEWEFNKPIINNDLLNSLTSSGFITILAHPGKTFYDIYPEKDKPTEKEFVDFLSKMFLEYNIQGAECDYRNYSDDKLNYNQITLQTMRNISKQEKIQLFASAGSDSHNGFS